MCSLLILNTSLKLDDYMSHFNALNADNLGGWYSLQKHSVITTKRNRTSVIIVNQVSSLCKY